MASSPTTEAGSTVEVMIVITGIMVGIVMVAGTFAPELLPWVNEQVNTIAELVGLDF